MKTYSKPTFEVVGILDDVLANISTMGSFTEDIFGENTDLAQYKISRVELTTLLN